MSPRSYDPRRWDLGTIITEQILFDGYEDATIPEPWEDQELEEPEFTDAEGQGFLFALTDYQEAEAS